MRIILLGVISAIAWAVVISTLPQPVAAEAIIPPLACRYPSY